MIAYMFEIFINILENGIIVDFLNRYFGFKYDKPKRYIFTLIVFLALLLQISLFNYYTPLSSVGTYVAVAILFLYSNFCLNGQCVIQFFISVFIMTAVTLIASGTILLFSNILGSDACNMITTFGPIRIIAVLFTKIVLFYLTRILLRLKEGAKLELSEILPLIIIPLISLLGITFIMDATYLYPAIQTIVLDAVLIIFAVNLVEYYLFVHISKENKAKIGHALLRQQYDSLRDNMEAIHVIYQEIRAERHDMKNHLLSLVVLIQQHECLKSQHYIEQLLQQDKVSFQILQTGNDVLDAVLGLKLATCRKESIKVQLNLQDALNFIEPTEISALFANIMDNAIDACRQSAEKRIELTIVPQQSYVAVTIRNSIKYSVLSANPTLTTTKPLKAEHGFGIRNIQRIVKKYNGLIDYYESENYFCLDILLENMQSKNESIHSRNKVL